MAARTPDVRALRLATVAVLVPVGTWTVLILVTHPPAALQRGAARGSAGHRDRRISGGHAGRGAGLPQLLGERLAVPFSRLAPDSGPPGSGLGLYVSRQIVEAHGGRIWVEPAADRGSRFSFTLPRA